MAHPAPFSSSITYKWTYDAFLSFHGEDTRSGFIGHLYHSLRQRGIHAFIDNEFLRTGENITPALFTAIQESRIAIIVFSENYANSTFCLRELVKILKFFKERSRLIYPVFYHVDPSELRRPRGSYAEALARLEERFRDKRYEVEEWRQALSQAADLKGCHIKPKIANEQECIAKITTEVAARINSKPLHVTNYPVGLEPRVKEVISCLDLRSTEEIKMIGIWGAGGIGKSTIARAIYNSIADNFEGLCFLSDVRRQCKMPLDLSHLQQTILFKLVLERDLKFSDYHEGIPIMKHRLNQKKILLILDNVDESDQLEALAGSFDWFGSGSRIIITTRNKQLLASHGVKNIHVVKELNHEESLKLLSWYAFGKENANSNYMEVCNRAIHYSCGFPLALKVIGSTLHGKGVKKWNSALDQFRSIPDGRVSGALKLSYDTLEEVEKQTFLDLACFFNGEKLADVIDILQCVQRIQLEFTIEMLIDKSLIKIEQGRVMMHDLVEDVGKEIVRQESSYEPGERSRLWFYQDILHVLQQDTGTNKVEAIILDLPESIEVQWSGEAFMKMKNLKILAIRRACFSECPKYLPNSLRWLEWKGYTFPSLPSSLPTELVYLDLSSNYCKSLQPFDKKFHNLNHMNLRNCKFLQQIPDLSGVSNLRELWVDGCNNLIEIHDSVGCLNKLKELSARKCKSLKILPSCLRLKSLKHLNLIGCSSLEKFPEISDMMEGIQTLDLYKTGITELPSSICNLIGLEMLDVEECPNLRQLPASICQLPKLWKLTADFCKGMSHFKMCECGDEASLDCSKSHMPKKSSKMEQLCFSNCNLSHDSLAFCLSHFTNMIHLDLSFNNFTLLPESIKEQRNLKYLVLDNCNQLQHIEGMPPNLEKFSATCCTALTKLSKSKVMKQALNFQPGKRNFVFPGEKLPKGLHRYYSHGMSGSFWVRNGPPMIFLWILAEYLWDFGQSQFSMRINNELRNLAISSEWLFPPKIRTDHIYICDLQSIIRSNELLALPHGWHLLTVSNPDSAHDIMWGVHVYNTSEEILLIEPRTTNPVTDHNYLCQKIREEEELEEMHLDSMHDQDRDISNELRPYWHLGILELEGYMGRRFPTWLGSNSYCNLIEVRFVNCPNCRTIPALGELPALRSLTIQSLNRVMTVGSEFYKAHHDRFSVIPFPSLEELYFRGMFNWNFWHSIDMQAFPKLHTLHLNNCPELTEELPHQLVSLQFLEITRCPLLNSAIPKCPKIQELLVSQSQNVVLQEQDLPPSLRLLTISGALMLEALSENLHIQDLIVCHCSKAVPVLEIHMPPSVKELTIRDCKNVKFVLVSEAPLVHLQIVSICDCKFLTSLFDDMERLLPDLKELRIERCPEMEPFSAGSLPSTLERLVIRNCDKLSSSHTQWLHLPTITKLIFSP